MIESMGQMAPFIDPDMILAMNWLFFVATLIVGLLIMFPAFISVQVDGVVDWHWVVVFIPAFIVDAFLLILILRIPVPPASHPDDETDSSHTQHNNDNASTAPKTASSTQGKLGKAAVVLYITLFILFQVLIAVNLDGLHNNSDLHWTWAQVFFPYYILEIFHFMLTTFSILSTLKMGKTSFTAGEQGQTTQATTAFTTKESVGLILDGYVSWLFRIAQMILFILKLDGAITCSWAVVFIPFYLSGIYKLVAMWVEYYILKQIMKQNPSLDYESGIMVKVVTWVFTAFLFYLGLGLLVSRLDSNMSGHPSTAIILIPVFFVLSILFLCVCCCLPCLTRQARMQVFTLIQ